MFRIICVETLRLVSTFYYHGSFLCGCSTLVGRSQAAPIPAATLAALYPPPDRKRTKPMAPPAAAPTTVLITPDDQ